MADKYSTIQQHQPLRVPQGWDKQEKALVVQLDEIFDDIYRRFGRLRMEDMGSKFRKDFADAEGNIAQLEFDLSGLTTRVSTAEGNISTLTLDVSGLTTRVSTAEGNIGTLSLRCDGFDVSIANKYGIVSGIEINANGIALSGSKYIDIASGCYIDIKSGGTIEIESGGGLNIKSGGALEVKSGGTFKIVSGGNIDIKASGTLELTGSTVTIKSGSTFDVDSTNFKLNSSTGSLWIKSDNASWTFNDRGLYLTDQNSNIFRLTSLDANTVENSDGIMFGKSNNDYGVRIYSKRQSHFSAFSIGMEYGNGSYADGYIVKSGNMLFASLGTSNNWFTNVYTEKTYTHRIECTDVTSPLKIVVYGGNNSWPNKGIYIQQNGLNQYGGVKISGSNDESSGTTSYHDLLIECTHYGSREPMNGVSTDLNDYSISNVGLYNLSSYTNGPSGLSGDIMLDVYSMNSSAFQIIYSGTGAIYTRKKNGIHWGSWYKFTGTAV